MAEDRVAIKGGKPLPFTPAEVKQIVMRMVDEGEILAIIVTAHNDIAVQVFGPPSMALVETLEEAARSLRTAVEHAS